ncbi:MAG TPA: bifunctional glycosyltransferase family 2/GtrA family protein [Candidatus Dormibacteraeota bacterium]|jgi:putative flippase GtrA|nr:bifunctional glycosyltransferase family 2/GtrA family protein [Candidatus Dormibacteraeota bacterium]
MSIAPCDVQGERDETLAGLAIQPEGADAAPPTLDVVIPVFNEEADLETAVRRLHAHLAAGFPYRFRITVADNASTDGTLRVARRVAAELSDVAVVHLDEKGRGRALHRAWSSSDAAVLAYMDVDLSTDLAGLLPLVAPLISGHSDLAIGTRLAASARVVRGPRREVISRCYNLLLRSLLRVRFTDAQCGFKAIRADIAARLLPWVRDSGWFFDTELLVLAERAGLRIHEVPVDWIDDPDSSVDIVATALGDLRGIVRMARQMATGAVPLARLRRELGRSSPDGELSPSLRGQAVRFIAIGAASTIAYLAIYLVLRLVAPAQLANLVALLLTAVANTAANRRLTFGVRGPERAGRHQLQGLVVFGVGLALTSGSLFLLHALTRSDRLAELAVLIAANATATAVRFLLFRTWVFRPGRTSPSATSRLEEIGS